MGPQEDLTIGNVEMKRKHFQTFSVKVSNSSPSGIVEQMHIFSLRSFCIKELHINSRVREQLKNPNR